MNLGKNQVNKDHVNVTLIILSSMVFSLDFLVKYLFPTALKLDAT